MKSALVAAQMGVKHALLAIFGMMASVVGHAVSIAILMDLHAFYAMKVVMGVKKGETAAALNALLDTIISLEDA